MALFGGKRDARFVAAINAELINSIIDTEIEFYKLIVEQSNSNIYGESDNEYYELDNVDANQYFTGKNPETWPNGEEHGYSVSVVCNAHVTRQTPQAIKDLRFGGTTNTTAYEGF